MEEYSASLGMSKEEENVADKEFMHGLTIRERETPTEYRAEIRTNDDHFVAWFHSKLRMSDGVQVIGTSAQIVKHEALTHQQIAMIQTWLIAQTQNAFTNRKLSM